MNEPIFHLADPSEWSVSDRSYRPRSVDEEGFVHCSTRDQLIGVARALYPDRDDLVLLTIDPDRLAEDTLVFEDLYGHGVFPHVYGPVPIEAVVATEPYQDHLEPGSS
ncbi:MAG TPA: DUF952 domain-containing protein [Acidimicrobiia bacterium]|nr:DUF952 domain-containing protein [Acidimicrobiia bacterium]